MARAKMFANGKFSEYRPLSEAIKHKMRKAARARWSKKKAEK
jgi:hypothetical protein